jgi:DNA-binding NarL/FixJ family response regulator
VSHTIRLLIADDHPVVRDGLRGIFEASGEFEVAGEAANGREAVDRAAALHPDVVLMDLRMPVHDGVSAIKLMAEKGTARGSWCSPPSTPTPTWYPRSRPAPPDTC